ncbi:MAG: hypothetical protein ABWZ52_01500 [Acidimicrobiales bacterium]
MPVDELSHGLAAGALAAVVLCVAAALARRSGRTGPVPGAGLGVVVAAMWAITRTRAVPVDVVLAVAGIAVISALPPVQRRLVATTALALPFAVILALVASSFLWVRILFVAAASLGAAAAGRTDACEGWSDLGPALYAMAAAGVFAAVPDTEEAAALLGAAVAVGALGWPIGAARLGHAGAASATALLVWVVAVGGRGRPPSIVGGVACLGLLLAAPIGAAIRDRWPRGRRGRVPPIPGLAVHALAVLVASRGAGILDELTPAVLLSLISLAIAVAGATRLTPPGAAR